MFPVIESSQLLGTIRRFVAQITFIAVLLALAAVVYYDDITIPQGSQGEAPSIYNTRLAGVKVIDAIAAVLVMLVGFSLVLQRFIHISPFHRYIGYIVAIYCYAGLVGFIYSFFYRYDYLLWLQDMQSTIYMVGFFFIVFYVLDTKEKWMILVVAFLALLAAKNVLILERSLSGVGRAFGDWAFRASQNSEFAYFPMMFFPFLLLILKGRSFPLRMLLLLVLSVYLFNSLLGIYRTVWVMLILGTAYLLFHLDRSDALKLVIVSGCGILVSLAVIGTLYPKFLDLAWNYKFASIFDWSVGGDRSNATRLLEIINISHRVFGELAFLQGMGLGAWWDDSARRLLPDLGAGFTYKTRFSTTHMLVLTQVLKLGMVTTLFYWFAVYKIFRLSLAFIKGLSWDRWEKSVLLGLNVGLFCAFVSSADFARLFMMIGINMAFIASYQYLSVGTHDSHVRSVSFLGSRESS